MVEAGRGFLFLSGRLGMVRGGERSVDVGEEEMLVEGVEGSEE